MGEVQTEAKEAVELKSLQAQAADLEAKEAVEIKTLDAQADELEKLDAHAEELLKEAEKDGASVEAKKSRGASRPGIQ